MGLRKTGHGSSHEDFMQESNRLESRVDAIDIFDIDLSSLLSVNSLQVDRERLGIELLLLHNNGLLVTPAAALSGLEDPLDQQKVLIQLLLQPKGPEGWLVHSQLVHENWVLPQLPAEWRYGFNPLLSYLGIDGIDGHRFSPHPLIDVPTLEQGLRAFGVDTDLQISSLLAHYLRLTPVQQQVLSPTTWFDPAWYLDSYPDLRNAGIERPFLHFVLHGGNDKRNPCEDFCSAAWLQDCIANAEQVTEENPLIDFLIRKRDRTDLNPKGVRPKGMVQTLNKSGELLGWAWDPSVDEALEIQLWLGNIFLGEALADERRDDLAHEGIRSGFAGFRIAFNKELGIELLDAIHSGSSGIELFTVDGRELDGSPWLPDNLAKFSLETFINSHSSLDTPGGADPKAVDLVNGHSDLLSIAKDFDEYSELLSRLEIERENQLTSKKLNQIPREKPRRRTTESLVPTP